ncbi:Sec1-like protein [Pseudoscourfieldia marina]
MAAAPSSLPAVTGASGGAGPSALSRALLHRLRSEVLGSVGPQDLVGSTWRVLVLDATTTPVLSACMKMADLVDLGFSLVEDLNKGREPMPTMPVTYFIEPSVNSVNRLIADWPHGEARYREARVYFSRAVPPQLLDAIKRCQPLISRLTALAEANVEFIASDPRAFTVPVPRAMLRLYGEASIAGGSRDADAACEEIGARLATVFATLGEAPRVRYRRVASVDAEDVPGGARRADTTRRVAEAAARALAATGASMGSASGPELLVVDRGFDAVAPVIHDFHYETLACDLFAVRADGVYVPPAPGTLDAAATAHSELAAAPPPPPPPAGAPSNHHVLGPTDELFGELRFLHVAEAFERLDAKLKDFTSRNAAARARKAGEQAGKEGSLQATNTRDLSKLVAALPEYQIEMRRLSCHVDMSARMNAALTARSLKDLGTLEQELVAGKKQGKDLVPFLSGPAGGNCHPSDKLRALICYGATHLRKFDGAKMSQWRKVANLTAADMAAIESLERLGIPVTKEAPKGSLNETSGEGKSTWFGGKKHNFHKSRSSEDMQEAAYELDAFTPRLADLVVACSAGELDSSEFVDVGAGAHQMPPPAASGTLASASAASAPKGKSLRSKRSSSSGGAPSGDDAYAAAARGGVSAVGGSTRATQSAALVVFVVGGVGRSEVRMAHLLSRKLGRDVIVGGCSIDTPCEFIDSLRSLGSASPL